LGDTHFYAPVPACSGPATLTALISSTASVAARPYMDRIPRDHHVFRPLCLRNLQPRVGQLQ